MKKLLCSSLLVMFFIPIWASAASLYIDPATATLNSGDSIKMAIRLDTDELANECVNAVDAVISYSDGIDPVDVSTGDSIFSMWVEQPTIDKENQLITFAGGIPNGYCGRIQGDPRLSNVLTEIVFRLPGFSIGGGAEADVATIAFSPETTAYLNDGRGTKANLNTYGSTINLDRKPGSEIQNAWNDEVRADTIPPEEFAISLSKDARAFSQKYYIVFNTTDKQTGIDHYEVIEEPLTQFGAFQWGRADAPWVETRSPYVLSDQSLNSIIRVKALDKAGNEYVATYIPDPSLRTLSQAELQMYIAIVGLSLVGLMVLTIFIVFFTRRKKSLKLDDKKEIGDEDLDIDEFENN